MHKKLILLFSVLTCGLCAQTKNAATFYADTTRLSLSFSHNRGEEYHKVLQTEWRINGETLVYGRLPLEVPVDTIGPDTIFYRQGGRTKWDTLICCISKPGRYTFVYNDCCNSFYLQDEQRHIVNAPVLFKINGNLKGKTFVAQLDNVGVRFSKAASKAVENDRGPMIPNVYPLLVREAVLCSDTATCKEGFQEQDQKTQAWESYTYRTVSTKLECYFLPLTRDTIRVTYNAKTESIEIRQ